MKIHSLKNLEEFLTSNGVDITTWGKGEAKTLSHLLQELIKEECTIYVRDGRVVRGVHALSINVLYKNEILKEEYQKFKDGRVRRRRMDCSVAEKLTTKELNDVDGSVSRAMSEELQISDITNEQVVKVTQFTRVRESGSYPGTLMDMVLYKYDVTLKYHQYHPYGYIEHQEDKDTFFVWFKRKDVAKFNYPLQETNNEWGNHPIESKTSEFKKKHLEEVQEKIKELDYILNDEQIFIRSEVRQNNERGYFIALIMNKLDHNQPIWNDKSKQKDKHGKTYFLYTEEYKEWEDRLYSICEDNGLELYDSGNPSTYTKCILISYPEGRLKWDKEI